MQPARPIADTVAHDFIRHAAAVEVSLKRECAQLFILFRMPTEAEERYERNIKVIDEFRRTGGQTRGSGRAPLLTSTRPRGGRERSPPLCAEARRGPPVVFLAPAPPG